MANNTQKAKDPTEVALSAIQDALNIRLTDMPAAPVPAPLTEQSAPTEAQIADLFRTEPSADGLRQPANDDREQVGEILQALQRRSSRAPYLMAGVAGLAWAVIGLGLAWAFSADIGALFFQIRNAPLQFRFSCARGVVRALL